MVKEINQHNSIVIRKSNERGCTDLGWLKSFHSFSFGEYHDEQFPGFRSLRVINDDRVAPGMGFGAHPHRDMEIISYVIEGELKHQDSMGNGSLIQAGQFQKMSAGSGVVHSEFNPSKENPVHFIQICIVPDKKGLAPEYQELSVKKLKQESLMLIAQKDIDSRTIRIHQDVRFYFGNLTSDQSYDFLIERNRGAWVQMIKGNMKLNDSTLESGDGAAVENVSRLNFKATAHSQFLLFDLR